MKKTNSEYASTLRMFDASLNERTTKERPSILTNKQLPTFIANFERCLKTLPPFPGFDYRGDVHGINARVTVADKDAAWDSRMDLMKIAYYLSSLPGAFGYFGDISSSSSANSASVSFSIYGEGLGTVKQEIEKLKSDLAAQSESKMTFQ